MLAQCLFEWNASLCQVLADGERATNYGWLPAPGKMHKQWFYSTYEQEYYAKYFTVIVAKAPTNQNGHWLSQNGHQP